MTSTLDTKIKELKEELDKITVRELVSDKEVLVKLTELHIIVLDFLAMVNPKKRPIAVIN